MVYILKDKSLTKTRDKPLKGKRLMKKIALTLLFVLAFASIANSLTVYRSADGNLYTIRDTVEGPEFEKVVVVNLSDFPDPPTPPDDPTTPEVDKFGLIKVSRDAAANINYPDKERHATRLSAFYSGLAASVRDRTIPNNKLIEAVNLVFDMAVGKNNNKWDNWKKVTTDTFGAAPINSPDDAAQALEDIAKGLVSQNSSVDNFEFENFFKFFIEVILPLILKLLGL